MSSVVLEGVPKWKRTAGTSLSPSVGARSRSGLLGEPVNELDPGRGTREVNPSLRVTRHPALVSTAISGEAEADVVRVNDAYNCFRQNSDLITFGAPRPTTSESVY